MKKFIDTVLEHRHKTTTSILLSDDGKIRKMFASDLPNFACLTYNELVSFTKTNKEFRIVSAVQCLAQDLLALRTMSIPDYLATKPLSDNVWNLRESFKDI